LLGNSPEEEKIEEGVVYTPGWGGRAFLIPASMRTLVAATTIGRNLPKIDFGPDRIESERPR
jgi:hypothetical protein